MMAVVDVVVDMSEPVGLIQLAGRVEHMQEWCSAMMTQRKKCTPSMISHQIIGTSYHILRISQLDQNGHITRDHVKMMAVL